MLRISFIAALVLGASQAFAAGGHVHGNGKLKIAAQGNQLVVILEIPQDGITGYERAPKNDKELELAKAAKALLADSSRHIGLTEAAQCKVISSKVNAPLLEKIETTPTKGEAHVDVVVTYEFACAQLASLNTITVNTFDHFKRVKVLQAELVGLKRQKGARLVSSSREIKL